jgi:hypothetical protein
MNFKEYLNEVNSADIKQYKNSDFDVQGFKTKSFELTDDKKSIIVQYDYTQPPRGLRIFDGAKAIDKFNLVPRAGFRNRPNGTWEVNYKLRY